MHLQHDLCELRWPQVRERQLRRIISVAVRRRLNLVELARYQDKEETMQGIFVYVLYHVEGGNTLNK